MRFFDRFRPVAEGTCGGRRISESCNRKTGGQTRLGFRDIGIELGLDLDYRRER
jgi:hypothetical protein